jgi:hypothetical protein
VHYNSNGREALWEDIATVVNAPLSPAVVEDDKSPVADSEGHMNVDGNHLL